MSSRKRANLSRKNKPSIMGYAKRLKENEKRCSRVLEEIQIQKGKGGENSKNAKS